MAKKVPITVAYGDGIGPEIMEATLAILDAAGARIAPETIEVGEKVYLRGVKTGMEDSAWDVLRRTKVFLKAPIGTPSGGGYRSLNVTTRTTLGLYANVRPCVSYQPFVKTKHSEMNVVIIRENEEDTYAGIEHQQTPQVAQCLKLITVPGCERIVRYAFEYAVRNHRKKVTCFTKDNIMKLTDGMFHKVFDRVKVEYPSIQTEHMIIDIGTARLADTPEWFDVVVTSNLYGDIISDVAAQITGSVGLAPSANIGDHCAMFEAVHGTAPTIAGQGIANPSGLLLAAVMMLVHLDQPECAEKVHNAWLKTIEDGIHTGDIYKEGISRTRAGTREFTAGVIERLGQVPGRLKPAHYAKGKKEAWASSVLAKERPTKETVGVDVFVDWVGGKPAALAQKLQKASGAELRLVLITNRGAKVWPEGFDETFCTDHWRCRFVAEPKGRAVGHGEIVALLSRLEKAGFDFIKTENLCTFDGVAGYSAGAED